MTDASPEERFRQAAEAEAGMAVVAGIKELVERSSVRATLAGLDPASGASTAGI
jgi:hypothetical protein